MNRSIEAIPTWSLCYIINGDADASGNGDEDGNEGKTDFAPVPAKEGMIKLGCHRKDGVEEIDGQRCVLSI